MTAAPPPRTPDLDTEQSGEGIHTLAHVAAISVTVGMLISLWGQWRPFIEVLLATVVIGVANVAVIGFVTRRSTPPVAETVRLMLNALGFMLNGHITGWLHLIWFYIPFNMLWYSVQDRWVRVRLAGFLVAVTAFALWDGADPKVALTFVLVGIFGYLLTERRLNLLRHALQQVIEQREQVQQAHLRLQQAHQRAMAQEKLSSLGMMAAGVAHEINNPMSFVTSNVSSLSRISSSSPRCPSPARSTWTRCCRRRWMASSG